MTKLNFLLQLHERLSGLPQNEVEERLTFYSEMIEDRMEEGLSEEDAVAAVGSIDGIAAQIASELSSVPVKEEEKPKRKRKVWEITLLALGSPLWIALLVAAFAVVLSIYISLWAVIVSLWAVFGALVGCGFGGVAGGAVLAIGGHSYAGVAMIAAGLVCTGLSIFLLYGCKAITNGTLKLTKKTFRRIFPKGGLRNG